MHPDDDVQVATFALPPDEQFVYSFGVPVQLGGRGKVVRMWAVHYHCYFIDPDSQTLDYRQALSENPEHLDRPPVLTAEFAQDKALYGRAIWDSELAFLPAAVTSERSRVSQLVPLYGLIRPRRQVWVGIIVQGLKDISPCIEVYYSPVNDLPRPIIDTINRARGKYRRS